MSVALSYKNASQAEIHAGVCGLTDKVVALRGVKGYMAQAKLQKARRERSELQALLTRPTLVWVNPATCPSK